MDNMSRLIKSAPGEYYHICNRGAGKKDIFHSDKDRARFLFLLLTLQSPNIIKNFSRLINEFSKNLNLSNLIDEDILKEIIKNRYVELISFTLMPNHFHILIKEKEKGGISKYIQRLLTSYTKYYNIKYEKNGHLFQGPYKIVHIKDDRQLMHVSTYIHRNPLEIGCKLANLQNYKWSSYYDYVEENRWGDFLDQTIILERFANKSKRNTGKNGYKKFVKTSPAKKDFE
jgi:putative transposase